MAYDATGKLHVMWRNSLDGSRDMYLCSSADGGLTFGEATKLGARTWQLDACPMDGGYLAISPKGTVFTAWRRDNEISLTADSSKEQRIGIGRQPWITATEGGPYVVWLGNGVNAPDDVAYSGNFHPLNVSPDESWVTDGEMLPKHGFQGDLLLARIRWSKANQLTGG